MPKSLMIHPFHQVLQVSPSNRVLRVRQRPHCFWLTGLSGAGKSTLGNMLDARLNQWGLASFLIDGDVLRHGLNSDLGFSKEDRDENVRRAAYMAELLYNAGVISIVSLISPHKSMRDFAKSLFPANEFSEIHIQASISQCIQRDPKGVYARYRKGQIRDISGLDAPYEAPEQPSLTLDTETDDNLAAFDKLWKYATEVLDFISP